MSGVGVVDQAADWSRKMVQREARGPGDLDNAMRRIEARYGIPYSIQWSLRYKRPKDLMASVYLRLQAAYRAECERQQKLLEHELSITTAKTGVAGAFARAASAGLDIKKTDQEN